MIDFDHLFELLQPLYDREVINTWRSGKARIHLALMQGDFLQCLVEGSKKIESRLSKARIAPVGRLDEGDLILFKQVGEQNMAVTKVLKARSGPLDDKARQFIRAHADEIGVDQEYLDYKSQSRYFALAWVKKVHVIEPLPLDKHDRRSWVILSERENQDKS